MQFDIAVIGGGPAGCAAAITAASKGAKVILFEAHGHSPRLRSVDKITDYLGVSDISGTELMDIFVKQLKNTTVTVIDQKVIFMEQLDDDTFEMRTSKENYTAYAVVLATGVSRSVLYSGEREFLGHGVSYCAEVDVDKLPGKKAAIIATIPGVMDQIGLVASKYQHVYYFPRFITDYEAPPYNNITVVNEQPSEICGTTSVTGVRTALEYYDVQACYVFRASDPANSFLPDLDISGRHIYVDDMAQTNVEGVFAGGDCTGKPWQVQRATGQGQKAALSAMKYIQQRFGRRFTKEWRPVQGFAW